MVFFLSEFFCWIGVWGTGFFLCACMCGVILGFVLFVTEHICKIGEEK